MSTTRRLTAPGGLSSNIAATPRRSGSLSATLRSTTYRSNLGSGKEKGGSLIVTRGLQELLDNERRYRRLRGATPTSAAGGAAKANRQRRRSGQLPNFIICYLCGRQFGTASIDIHRPQCYLKRLIMWERGDPASRGPKPISPTDHERLMQARMASAKTPVGLAATGRYPSAGRKSDGGLGRQTSLREVDFYNELQMNAFKDVTLSPCPNCGRTFLPDRLQVHLRSCRPGKTARPIRAASSPPTSLAATLSRVTASAAPASVANRPIRTAGVYTVPANAGAGGVPPRAAPSRRPTNSAVPHHTFLEVVDSKGSVLPTDTSPSRSPGGAFGQPGALLPDAHAPDGATAAAKAQDGDVIEVELDVDVEATVLRPSGVDTERRLSSVAVMGADPEALLSSALKWTASRELGVMPPLSTPPFCTEELGEGENSNGISYTPVSMSTLRDHAAGSRPRGTQAPRAPSTANTAGMMEKNPCEDLLVTELQYTSTATYSAAARVAADDGAEKGRDNARKIQLNNVSHFKNVPSKVKLQRQSEEAKLVACKHCARTFLPERVQKHENCCTARSKPLGMQKSETLPVPLSTNAVTTRRAKVTPAAPAVDVGATGRKTFCGGCGRKVSSSGQRFCSDCGYKL
ncbi:hypothetical protein LSCM1_02007 [Leishmania martiniquensis]|uniref:C2HC/C3H-type domain-containing protein n=1 Tax=Leishmania martiniquensis TaxID=1580590 RepID=A0A836H657_9TRYP|nr:hypothetical protein LSCM1_02007 [Leishmania martiniquensis]